MRRIILMAIMLALTVAGCNRFPDLSVQVTANLSPSDGECSVSPDQEAVVGVGRLDLNLLPSSYSFTPRIESYLFDNSTDIQAPSQSFQVTSFDVTIKLPDNSVPELAGGLPNPYNVTATSSVILPSEEPDGISRGTAYAEVIPSSYRDALVDIFNNAPFDSIVLDIRANGNTTGGFSQQSPSFNWPVELCNGCLAARCPEPARIGDGLGCFPGQDSWQYCAEITVDEAAAL